MNGATCVDGSNNYTCNCVPGYTGFDCETNIDDCAPAPCLNDGMCKDGVNSYTCNCTNTGYTGLNCELDIDECAEVPCRNNATCNNLKNDYSCNCWDGFQGKDCENDVDECAGVPCQYNGTCYERSNQSLYMPTETLELPEMVRDTFSQPFNYQNASGYVCSCLAGIQGNFVKKFFVFLLIYIYVITPGSGVPFIIPTPVVRKSFYLMFNLHFCRRLLRISKFIIVNCPLLYINTFKARFFPRRVLG